MHPFIEYVNPYLGDQLQRLNIDKQFLRGENRFLYDVDGNKYLDFIASYGALPFGFNPPEIWDAILKVRDSKEPSFIQPSALEAAGALAKRLIELAPPGLRYVTFTNSGTETTEAAIKLARSATKKFKILSTINSFHGKTLGALSATGKASYQEAFGAPIEGFDLIPYGDIGALKNSLAHNEYAAFIVEPIQGEGGIIIPPPGYLRAAQEACKEAGVLLILDEVQTGLGRTGRLFACEEEAVTPDIMLLAKALGGGILPIGACLSTEEAYNEEFALKHSSTFAGNTLACRVGLAVLDILTKDDCSLLKQVTEKGEMLKKGLQSMAEKYPHVVREVRGKGLMIGVDFDVTEDTFPETLLGIMAEQEILTPVLASYLLNVERLRVAPTLNGSNVIRIEPSLNVTYEECQWALDGFERMLSVLGQGSTAGLVSHLIDVPVERVLNNSSIVESVSEPENKAYPSDDPEEGRFAFLVHPVSISNYSEFDKTLTVFGEEETLALSDRWNDLVDPFVVGTTKIRSITGQTAYGEFIALPHTADSLLALRRKESVELVRSAAELAVERGARIVGLGAYTSVVTRGGKELQDMDVALTTGNSYTAASAIDACLEGLTRFGSSLSQVKAAVVGATGAIGRLTAILLAEEVQQLFLIGNPKSVRGSKRRLLKVAAEIYQHLAKMIAEGKEFSAKSIGGQILRTGYLPEPDASLDEFINFATKLEKKQSPIIVTTALEKVLPMADVTITATSSVCELIMPEMLKFGAIVCDMSRPPNVSRTVKDARPDVLVIDGGVVAVPGLPSLGWDFGFGKGLAYACMSETFMLGLEHHYKDFSIGPELSMESVAYTRELAAKHGFELAGLRSFDRPLTHEEWERVCKARLQASAI